MPEVEPGSKLWPYHTHYLNEEWMIVLRGEDALEHAAKRNPATGVRTFEHPRFGVPPALRPGS